MKQWKLAAWALFALLIMFVIPSHSSAQLVDINGGIKNEYEYEEYVFVTGRPVLMKGSGNNVKVTIKETKTGRTETYNVTLKGSNGETLTRKATYTYDTKLSADGKQRTNTTTKATVSESIKIGSTTFKLADYQVQQSILTQLYPANEYYTKSGNVRKTYTYKNLAGQDSKIIVNGQIHSEGYENYWGAVETQITEFEYIHGVDTVNETTSYLKNVVSESREKSVNYEQNLASLSSFNGGWMTNIESDAMSAYTYDFENFNGEKGVVELNKEYMTTVERLPVAKYRDISKHSARESIEKMYALSIYNDSSNFFSPNTPTLRYDFIVALGKAIDLRIEEDGGTKSTGDKSKLFKDVATTKSNYEFLVAAYRHGITTGATATTFNPNATLTRQQAAAMLVRALGLESKAPDPGYRTKYSDDAKISDYARDAVYVATELNLLKGSNGKFNPKGQLTRSQATIILERFLQYLEVDLKQNYGEDIWFFE